MNPTFIQIGPHLFNLNHIAIVAAQSGGSLKITTTVPKANGKGNHSYVIPAESAKVLRDALKPYVAFSTTVSVESDGE